MIIQRHFTDDQLIHLFTKLGYDTEFVVEPRFEKVGHNIDKEYDQNVLHVITPEGLKKADDFFNELADKAILAMIKNLNNE
jgi:hypothetical protein